MVFTKRWYGLIVNPNTAAVRRAENPDPVFGLPDDVTRESEMTANIR